MKKILFSRREISAALPLLALTGAAAAQTSPPTISVTKDPNCGCCTGWVEHLRKEGFSVRVTDTADLDAVKKRLGVPEKLEACHTAEAGGYVIEGHVPAGAIRRLLAEKPAAKGLAVPGMPVGSPGMEAPGHPADTYDVILFGPAGEKRFARYRGERELAE